jgi:ribose 1,5-bisphosphokinase
MLVAVVGPSGAGKDTLMGLARARVAGDARFVFVQRAITRPAEAGGEDHRAVSAPEFAAERAAGGFALWWEAHGLSYGIPRAMEDDLAAGRVVVANLSRGVLAEAARYRLRVLVITAPVEVLAARLTARGRETVEDIAARLAREAPLPAGLDVVTVMNDTTPEDGGRARGRGVAGLRMTAASRDACQQTEAEPSDGGTQRRASTWPVSRRLMMRTMLPSVQTARIVPSKIRTACSIAGQMPGCRSRMIGNATSAGSPAGAGPTL